MLAKRLPIPLMEVRAYITLTRPSMLVLRIRRMCWKSPVLTRAYREYQNPVRRSEGRTGRNRECIPLCSIVWNYRAIIKSEKPVMVFMRTRRNLSGKRKSTKQSEIGGREKFRRESDGGGNGRIGYLGKLAGFWGIFEILCVFFVVPYLWWVVD